MKRNLVLWLFGLIAAIILSAAPAGAQSTATVQGTVLDTQSAAVPGATVVVRNTATGVERTLVTDASGSFIAASLPPGPYQVEISLQGFQTQTRDITLQVSQTRALDIQLGVAAVAEQVNVTAEAPVIDTATVSVGTVINQRTVQEIPLNGRHFVDLGLLIPGVGDAATERISDGAAPRPGVVRVQHGRQSRRHCELHGERHQFERHVEQPDHVPAVDQHRAGIQGGQLDVCR
jgi:hypothetical protein